MKTIAAFILVLVSLTSFREHTPAINDGFNFNKTNSTDSEEYFVAFFGEKQNSSSPVGHAFIGIGKGTPMTCNLDGSETQMMGFYPAKRVEGGKSFWFGPVSGQVKNDVRTKTDLYVFKKIDFAEYIKVQLKIEEWKKKQYELTRQDCISFFTDVASLFGDLTLPDRQRYSLPEDYVATFILLNKNWK